MFGTQLTDNFEGNGDIPNNMVAITIVSAALVAIVFAVWWYVERTLSMHSIRTHRREAFYWAAVCATFAMGTAVGDLVAEKLGLGYLSTLLVFVDQTVSNSSTTTPQVNHNRMVLTLLDVSGTWKIDQVQLS